MRPSGREFLKGDITEHRNHGTRIHNLFVSRLSNIILGRRTEHGVDLIVKKCH